MDIERAVELIRHHLNANGLIEWQTKIDGGKRRFGYCCWETKTISLSRHLVSLNTEHEVLQTILHEIAHALAPFDHHGPTWERKCRELGIIPARCYDAEHRNVVKVQPNYFLVCPSCLTEYPRFRKTSRSSACADCCTKFSNGRYDERFKMTYK